MTEFFLNMQLLKMQFKVLKNSNNCKKKAVAISIKADAISKNKKKVILSLGLEL